MAIRTINPATGVTEREFTALTPAEMEEKIQSSLSTFQTYRRTPIKQRAEWLLRAAAILETEKETFAAIMTREMGKPLRAAADEAAKCATACRYYAEHGESLLKRRPIQTSALRSEVRYDPMGPVLAVMPWNFPFWQVFRFAAPTLMAGNTCLLKHASNVPQCALAIEDILRRAGFPRDAFQTLLITASQVDGVICDPRVTGVTLTGSEGAGSHVAGAAGKVIKKTVLELGGSDPFIVMSSARLDGAVATAVRARCINNGQSCIAAKRFIVLDSVYQEFERRFVDAMRALKVGDPMDAATDIGPLATEQVLHDLEDQVSRAVASGARLLTGGRAIDLPGYYFPPTVLAGLPRTAPVYREETFGPVANLFRVRDIDEAIEVANDTSFGLGASVWSGERLEQDRFIEELQAGMVFVNGMVASDARLPFGGVKRSGYGRELGEYGILEFVNIKTVWIGE